MQRERGNDSGIEHVTVVVVVVVVVGSASEDVMYHDLH
jgi:hypothetical protein